MCDVIFLHRILTYPFCHITFYFFTSGYHGCGWHHHWRFPLPERLHQLWLLLPSHQIGKSLNQLHILHASINYELIWEALICLTTASLNLETWCHPVVSSCWSSDLHTYLLFWLIHLTQFFYFTFFLLLSRLVCWSASSLYTRKVRKPSVTHPLRRESPGRTSRPHSHMYWRRSRKLSSWYVHNYVHTSIFTLQFLFTTMSDHRMNPYYTPVM